MPSCQAKECLVLHIVAFMLDLSKGVAYKRKLLKIKNLEIAKQLLGNF